MSRETIRRKRSILCPTDEVDLGRLGSRIQSDRVDRFDVRDRGEHDQVGVTFDGDSGASEDVGSVKLLGDRPFGTSCVELLIQTFMRLRCEI